MPERIQLSRAKGWRKPDGAIVVSRPSKWGNPFMVGSNVNVSGIQPDGAMFDCVTICVTPEMAVAMFRDLMQGRLSTYGSDDPEDEAYVAGWRDQLEQLRGHDLACWCRVSAPCHGDVLLELANS